MDDLEHIFKVISDDAKLSKWAGGWATTGRTSAAPARDQRHRWGKPGRHSLPESRQRHGGCGQPGRQAEGAMCAYLETWHWTSRIFWNSARNTGDERRRTHDMNTANWIPDLFMKRVAGNGTGRFLIERRA